MNVDFLSSFGSDAIPEQVSETIQASALVARFNPYGLYAGHFLAVGRSDGIVSIYDFETKNIVRVLEGHVKAITAIWWGYPPLW